MVQDILDSLSSMVFGAAIQKVMPRKYKKTIRPTISGDGHYIYNCYSK